MCAKAWQTRIITEPPSRGLYPAAVGSLGFVSRVGDHLVAVEKHSGPLHNMIVSRCSPRDPWEVLGLRPPGTIGGLSLAHRALIRAAFSPISAHTADTRHSGSWDRPPSPLHRAGRCVPEGTDGLSETARDTLHPRLHDRHRLCRAVPTEATPLTASTTLAHRGICGRQA